MSDQSLLLFQLGPVQSFIAQAETIGDLAAGSDLLSQVTAAALEKVTKDNASKVVFPNKEGNENLKGIPNRFLVFVPREEAKKLAEDARRAAQEKLKELAEDARKKVADKDAFDKQIEAFLQITWAILEHPTGNMGADYEEVGRLMALRRNTREFKAWHEVGGQVKDFLSGKENALNVEKTLGAMNLTKRELSQQFSLALPTYFAVVAMDGDNMGKALSTFETVKDHQDFSKALTDFAKRVKEISNSEEYKATLIYAGGDDVLAIIDAKKAVAYAQDLSGTFREVVKVNGVSKTASAGIAIAHKTTPLQDVVHAAHKAESQAKQVYRRDALALAIYKRSGEILGWGCRWDSPALEIYKKLSELDRQQRQIGGFPYKLSRLLQPYELNGAIPNGMHDVVMAEFKHAVAQTEGIKGELDERQVETYLVQCESKRIEDFLTLFLVEAFINRPPKEN